MKLILVLSIAVANVQKCKQWPNKSWMDEFNKQIHLWFLRAGVMKTCSKFTGEHLIKTLYQNMRLWRRCFLVNFLKFLRTPFLTEHLRWLLLYACFEWISQFQIIAICPLTLGIILSLIRRMGVNICCFNPIQDGHFRGYSRIGG